MKKLLSQISACEICKDELLHGVRPVISVSSKSRILLVGQAPGRKVHQSGIPWNDKSGEQLRVWLGVNAATFYDTSNFGIVPMGFCYPGKGKSGDLPPRPECAKQWHRHLLIKMKQVQLTLLVGSYAQKYYLGSSSKSTLTETVRSFCEYLPAYFPLVHPSPRNGIWLRKNKWFEAEVVPELRQIVKSILIR